MLETKGTKVFNFENAIYGMRNPMESWEKIDSYYDEEGNYILGENDLNLAKRLRNAKNDHGNAGSDHRKYLRQFKVSVHITAPLYWWKEFDTYKVGTVANSTSTMHKLASRDLTLKDFSVERCNLQAILSIKNTIKVFNEIRAHYVETKDKTDWYSLIQTLPLSFNQTRTLTMNYENLINMYYARKDHKLDEWHTFCDWIMTLPYANELIIGEPKQDNSILEKEIEELKQENERLKQELESLRQENERLKQELEELKQNNAEYQIIDEPQSSDSPKIKYLKSNNFTDNQKKTSQISPKLKINWDNSLEQ